MSRYGMFDPSFGNFGGSSNFGGWLGSIGTNFMGGMNDAMAFHNNYMDYDLKRQTQQNRVNASQAGLLNNEALNALSYLKALSDVSNVGAARATEAPSEMQNWYNRVGNPNGSVNNQQSVVNTTGTQAAVNPANTNAMALAGNTAGTTTGIANQSNTISPVDAMRLFGGDLSKWQVR